MLFICTFLFFSLAMIGLGIKLLLGEEKGPGVGCGSECRCNAGIKGATR